MTGLSIGKAGARRFALPTEVASQATAVLGIRGSGKTVTGTVIVEELLEIGWPVVVIDPVDVWWGLKSRGARPGYPVVVIGNPRADHTDLPLTAESGAILADFAVDRSVPMVLSLRHLRKGQQVKFVMEFTEQLYHRKGEVEHRTPVLVVIDEASAFVPQHFSSKGQDAPIARCVGAIEDLVRRGRSAGVGVLLIDQRPASVNKNVLTQLDVLVAHRVTSPQDTKALLEWVDLHDTEGRRKEFLASLAALPRGTAWFWSPMLDLFDQVAVRMRHTVDSSRTPKAGEKPVETGKLAAVDLDALRAQLEETIAEVEANDPKALRRRIAELERFARKAPEADPREIQRAVEEASAALEQRIDVLEVRLEKGHAIALELVKALSPSANGGPPPKPVHLKRHVESSRAADPRRPVKQKSNKSEGLAAGRALTGTEHKILDALAWFEALGIEPASRVQVAMVAGYHTRTKSFINGLGALRSGGFIQYPSTGMVGLTEVGRVVAEPPGETPTNAAMHEMIRAQVGPSRTRILDILIDAYPEAVAREDLARALDYHPRTKAFINGLGSLRTLGVVEYPSPGFVAATDLLFPRGAARV